MRWRTLFHIIRWAYFLVSETIGVAGIPGDIKSWSSWIGTTGVGIMEFFDSLWVRAALVVSGGLVLTYPQWAPTIVKKLRSNPEQTVHDIARGFGVRSMQQMSEIMLGTAHTQWQGKRLVVVGTIRHIDSRIPNAITVELSPFKQEFRTITVEFCPELWKDTLGWVKIGDSLKASGIVYKIHNNGYIRLTKGIVL